MRSKPIILIETPDYRLAYEVFDNKTYLHSDVQRINKKTFIELYGYVQDIGKKVGLLYTYSPNEQTDKLCKHFDFTPTGQTVPFWFDEKVEFPEYILMNEVWEKEQSCL